MSFLSSLFRSQPRSRSGKPLVRPAVSRPTLETHLSQPAKADSTPRAGNVVKRDETPLSQKRGWQQRGNQYAGYFATRDGTWFGNIERRGDKFAVFIKNPPTEEISYHPKAMCFYPHPRHRGWYEINLSISPRDIDSILHFVERLLVESFDLAAKDGEKYPFATPPRTAF